jgi:tRNA G10  N-methylase Trm11
MPSAAEVSLRRPPSRSDSNRLEAGDRAAHDWYRFVLSFPPHLVRDYINRFELGPDAFVLDPFCGTRATIVETVFAGIPSIGFDAHPFATLISSIRTNRQSLDAGTLRGMEKRILKKAKRGD